MFQFLKDLTEVRQAQWAKGVEFTVREHESIVILHQIRFALYEMMDALYGWSRRDDDDEGSGE